MPDTENRVGASTANVMPAGGSTTTGWLKPSANSRFEPRQRDAVADADDLQLLLVAGGHAGDEVLDERARQAVHGLAAPLVVRPLELDGAVVGALDRDRLDDGVRQGALGPLDRHRAAVDGHVHPGRHGDRKLPDAGHVLTPHQT
jgi:hypothetical protein